ncbi:hypothetical protein TNCV_2654601 [Trichonephila clavipes]|nr:hypothetical protein TNCV_2654601 [Trichonephila clavipes]
MVSFARNADLKYRKQSAGNSYRNPHFCLLSHSQTPVSRRPLFVQVPAPTTLSRRSIKFTCPHPPLVGKETHPQARSRAKWLIQKSETLQAVMTTSLWQALSCPSAAEDPALSPRGGCGSQVVMVKLVAGVSRIRILMPLKTSRVEVDDTY